MMMGAEGARSNPFPGLRPFTEDEAELLFGRDQQSDEFVRRLGRRRFVAVVGTSGSGKSSLVRAGLLPSLHGGLMAGAGANWRIAVMRPQDDPIGYLAASLAGAGLLSQLKLPPATAAALLETTLRRSSFGLVEAVRLARLEPRENLLVVADQFEELFRFADVAARHGSGDDAPAFVKLLLTAAAQEAFPIYVVLTMRSDFLGDCARFRDLPEAINDSQYLVPRLTRDELHAVVTGPVGVCGGRVSPGLVQHLLNNVGDDMDQLPLLQHALMRSWDHWTRDEPDARALDLADLDAVGGMTHALSRHADEALRTLDEPQRSIAERMFKGLTEKGPDNREVRRPTDLARIAAIADVAPADVVPVIEAFRAPERAFLMPPAGTVLDERTVIDISHESLIRQWQRLREWVDQESESRAIYLRIVEAARLWRAGKGGLWGEPDLTYARQWRDRQRPNAPWAAQYAPGFDEAMSFLRESETAHAAAMERERQRGEEERRSKERELAQARALAEAQRQRADEQAAARARQKRFSAALLGLLAVALALYAWQQRRAAEQKRVEAEQQTAVALSRQLAVQAGAPDRSSRLTLLFATVAYRVAPTLEARSMLQRSLNAMPRLVTYLAGPQGGILDLAFSPDGATITSVHGDGGVRVYDVAGRHAAGPPIAASQDRLTSAAFSRDGRTIALGVWDKIVLWDVVARQALGAPLEGHVGGITTLSFSPDGQTLASGGEDLTVRLWDVRKRAPLMFFEGHAKPVLSLAFSADGTRLASGSGDQTVRLWDVAARKADGDPLDWNAGIVTSLAFSRDGKSLALGSYRNIGIWDLPTRRRYLEPLIMHRDFVRSLQFSRGGATLASASDDGNVVVWNVSSGKPLFQPFSAHQRPVAAAAFSPDQTLLASAGADGTIILWAVDRHQAVSETLNGHVARVTSVASSGDGRLLASGSHDGTAILWDLTAAAPTHEVLSGHRSSVVSIALSADGKTLASGSDDGTVILWDTATRKARRDPLRGHEQQMIGVAISADSRVVASTDGRTIIFWDAQTGDRLGDAIEATTLQQPLQALAFAPDSKTLAAAAADGTIPLVDVPTRSVRGQPLMTAQKLVNAVAYSPDGKTLVSGSQDGLLILWNLVGGEISGEPLLKNRLSLSSVAFSPDGRTVASGDTGGGVQLWDVVKRRALGEPVAQNQPNVTSMVFVGGGHKLATTSGDDVVIWDIDPESWMRKACSMANRNLSHREWTQYVGDDVPYRAPCPDLAIPEN